MLFASSGHLFPPSFHFPRLDPLSSLATRPTPRNPFPPHKCSSTTQHDSIGRQTGKPTGNTMQTAMYTTRKELDMHFFEHAVKPGFWLLGALIVGFCAANLAAYARHRRSKGSRPLDSVPKKEHDSSSAMPSDKPRLEVQPEFTAWTTAYLTTRLRTRLAVAIYLVVLGAQLLEGYWVMVTLARWTVKLFSRWPQSSHSVAYWVYFLSAGLMLLTDFIAVAVGGFIVMFQLCWISELVLQGAQLAVK